MAPYAQAFSRFARSAGKAGAGRTAQVLSHATKLPKGVRWVDAAVVNPMSNLPVLRGNRAVGAAKRLKPTSTTFTTPSHVLGLSPWSGGALGGGIMGAMYNPWQGSEDRFTRQGGMLAGALGGALLGMGGGAYLGRMLPKTIKVPTAHGVGRML